MPATPGGAHSKAQHTQYDALYGQASDHKPAAQANRAGGHSPAWHGGAPDAHRNATAHSRHY